MTLPKKLNRASSLSLLQSLGVREDAYSLHGEAIHDRYVLEEIYGEWHVYYFERGLRIDESVFRSEAEACRRLVQLLESDPTTRESYHRRASALLPESPHEE